MLVIVHSVCERSLPTKSKENHTRNKNMYKLGSNTNNQIYSTRTIYKIANKCNGLTPINPQWSHQAVATSQPNEDARCGARRTREVKINEKSYKMCMDVNIMCWN